MTLSSLEMIERCEQRGFLSKEAAAEIRTVRKELIKQAVKKGFLDLFQKAKAMPEPVKAKGWFEKLREPAMHPDKGQKKVWGDVTSNLAKMLGLAGLTAGAAGGLNLGVHRMAQGRQRQMIEDSYKKIYDEEPGLHTIDPEKVRRHFGVIARYAPSIAADPVVASSMVHSLAQRAGGEIQKDVKMLSDLEGQIRKSREMTPVVKPEKAVGWAAKGIGLGGGDDD